jgi:hypothetical protein
VLIDVRGRRRPENFRPNRRFPAKLKPFVGGLLGIHAAGVPTHQGNWR